MTTFEDTIKLNNWVVLDTETTDLPPRAEVCQIAIVDWKGETLLNSLVKPTGKISHGAERIHGISQAMVDEAPTWADIYPETCNLLRDRDLFVYNLDFDWQALLTTHRASMPDHDVWAIRPRSRHCAMVWYADVWGEWDDYHGNNRWQKLDSACHQQGLIVPPNMHSALVDAQATRNLILAVMAKNAQ